MLPSQLFFWNHVYNAAVKAAVNRSGPSIGPCRTPVRPLTDAQMQGLKDALAPLAVGEEAPERLAV